MPLTSQSLFAQEGSSAVTETIITTATTAITSAMTTAITTTVNTTAEAATDTAQVIIIGITEEPLQQQVGALLERLLLERGHHVVTKSYRDSKAILDALEGTEIGLGLASPVDALVLHYGLPLNALPTDSDRLLQFVDNMAARKQSQWLTALPMNQDYALFTVRDERERQENDSPTETTTATFGEIVEQWQRSVEPVTVCHAERYRSLWPKIAEALSQSYQFAPDQVQGKVINTPASAESLADAGCALWFGAQSTVLADAGATTLTMIADTDYFFPPNHPSLVVREATIESMPDIASTWAALVNVIDKDALTQLQELRQGQDVNTGEVADAPDEAAAFQFLLDRGLVQLPVITIGTRDETTQEILGAIVMHLLASAGYPVTDLLGALSAVDLIDEAVAGNADIVIVPMGEALTLHSALPLDDLPKDRAAALTLLNSDRDAPSFVIMQPVDFSLARVLLVDRDLAGLGITTLSRLTTYMNRFEAPFSICVDSEFFSHPATGLGELEAFYGFQFAPEKILLMDEDTIFSAIQEGQCQVTVGTSTDGRIAAWNLLPLRDDKAFFPPNQPLTIVRRALFQRLPQLATLLESYVPLLDTATMQQLTTLVELGPDGVAANGDEQSPQQAARVFLEEYNLLGAPAASDDTPSRDEEEAAIAP